MNHRIKCGPNVHGPLGINMYAHNGPNVLSTSQRTCLKYILT